MKKYFVAILIITLLILITTGINQVVQSQIEAKDNNINLNSNNQDVNENKNVNKQPLELIAMEATAYDLSKQCCTKSYSNPSRGKTKDGYNLTNKTHKEALTVASTKFPMGTKLKLTFDDSHKQYNGVYTVRDSGNFKEGVLDVYIGDFGESVHPETIKFGRVEVQVEVIK